MTNLQKTFTFNLSVTEEECDWKVLQSSLQHTGFNVFTPFIHAIIFRQLNLE